MLTIIRKHIFKTWMSYFLGSVIILILLITVANLVSGFLRSSVTPTQVIINHFIGLPQFSSMFFPVASLVASMLAIDKLKNRNELTAIFASGFSRRDFVAVLIASAMLVGGLQFITSAYVAPFTLSYKHVLLKDAARKFGNLDSKGLMTATLKTGRFWYKTPAFFMSFLAFDKTSNELKKPCVYEISSNGLISNKVNAENAIYLGDGNWKFKNLTITQNLDETSFPQEQKREDLDVKLGITLQEFKEAEADITTLNINQLSDYIDNLNSSGISTTDYAVTYWDKFSSSLICIIFALLAGTGIFNPNRRSSSLGFTVVFTIGFSIIYWFSYTSITSVGRTGALNPIVSCFAVPCIFIVYLGYVFYKNKDLN